MRAGLCAVLCALVLSATLISAIDVAVPSYIYPGGTAWQNIVSAGSKVKIALINPLNGPGFTKDTNYVNQALACRAAGIQVYGYVHSTYGQASLDEIKRNVTTYYSWYAIDGVFVDEASTDCGYANFYQTIYNHIKGYGGTVVINPGVDTNECYMSAADIVMNAENSWQYYKNAYTPPSWIFKYDPHRFWHIVHTAPQSSLASAVSIAVSRHAGYVFVTDADGAVNPYDKLPTYWNSLLAAATPAPTTPPPPPPTTTTQKPTTTPPPTTTTQKATTAPPSTTQKPTTAAPTTQKPTTIAPTTQQPTQVTTTQAPTTTQQATTAAPATTQRVTTAAPVTSAVSTAAPATINYAIGVTVDGGAGSYAWAASPESCDSQCQAMVGCVGWSYDLCGSGSCWLKTELGTRVHRTCRASRVYSAAALELPADASLVGRWNFAPANVTAPVGFIADRGEPFGPQSNGLTYGWNAKNAESVERNSIRSANKAYDTFSRLQVGGWWYHWEVAVPAGYYSVRVVAGDPEVFECQDMEIENVPLVRGCPSTASPWVEFSGVVTVSDGRLGITNTPGAWSNNKLCFVEIAHTTGPILSTVVLLASPSKRQAHELSSSAFVAMLSSLSGQPGSRFLVLRSTVSRGTQHFDYMVLDAMDNSSTSSAEIATRIVVAPLARWSMSVLNTSVLSEAGPVPASYAHSHSNDKKTIAIVVPVLVVAAVVITATAVLVVVLVLRKRQQHKVAALGKRPSLVSLIGHFAPPRADSSSSVMSSIDCSTPEDSPRSDTDVSPRSDV